MRRCERGAGSPAGPRFLLLIERQYHARTAMSQVFPLSPSRIAGASPPSRLRPAESTPFIRVAQYNNWQLGRRACPRAFEISKISATKPGFSFQARSRLFERVIL